MDDVLSDALEFLPPAEPYPHIPLEIATHRLVVAAALGLPRPRTRFRTDRQLFAAACGQGHRWLVRILVERDNLTNLDFNTFLGAACYNGDPVVIDMLISTGRIDDYNFGLRGACRNGQVELVQRMLDAGADNLMLGLEGACRGNSIRVIDMLFQRATAPIVPNGGVRGACLGGHIHLVRRMIARGGKYSRGYVRDACHGGVSVKFIDELFDVIDREYWSLENARHKTDFWHAVLLGGSSGGHPDLVRRAIQAGADKLNIALAEACMYNQPRIFKLLIEHGASDWDWAMRAACRSNSLPLIRECIQRGATHFTWALAEACLCGRRAAARLMAAHGATFCRNCHRPTSTCRTCGDPV